MYTNCGYLFRNRQFMKPTVLFGNECYAGSKLTTPIVRRKKVFKKSLIKKSYEHEQSKVIKKQQINRFRTCAKYHLWCILCMDSEINGFQSKKYFWFQPTWICILIFELLIALQFLPYTHRNSKESVTKPRPSVDSFCMCGHRKFWPPILHLSIQEVPTWEMIRKVELKYCLIIHSIFNMKKIGPWRS